MAANESKRATEILTCRVCFQVFRNPKYLICYHSYCEECLEKKQNQSKILCPDCRKETAVPAGGVKELPNNFFMNHLVDEFILKRKVEGEEDVKCDKCDEDDPVVSYCPDCSLFLCQVCNEAHKRDKSSRGHSIVPLTELRSNKAVPVQAKVKVPLCKEHDYELKHYCETCEQLVCVCCTVKEHSDHSHDTVKKMADKHRKELQKITSPIGEMIRGLSEVHSNIDKTMNKIRQQSNEVDKKIDHLYDALIQKLLEQKEQLKQQAHDAVSEKEEALTVQLEKVRYAQAEILNMKKLKEAVEESSDQEVLSAKKQVIAHMQQITDKYKKLDIHLSQSVTIEFILTNHPFPQFGKVHSRIDPSACRVKCLPHYFPVGEMLEFSIITKYHDGYHCSMGGNQASVQLESNTGEVISAQVKDNNDGSYTASIIPQCAGKAKLHVSMNGQQINESPYNLVIQCNIHNYNKVDKPSKVVNKNNSMGRPWGIAFNRNGMWAVVDYSKHNIHIYDDKDQLIHTFSTMQQLRSPTGIAFDNNNRLYVADRGCKCVKKFDLNGTYLLTLDGTGAGLRDPVGITTHNHIVYIADYKCKCVIAIQTNSQFCRTIGKGQIQGPYDVAVNTNDCLLVTGWDEGCIYRFTLEGNYIDTFGGKGMSEGLLHCPSSLTTDSNGFILVAEYTNNRVSIFDNTGKFVHCFGSIGYDGGQFHRPYGIALAPDGSIYVSDMMNKRVQIFSVV